MVAEQGGANGRVTPAIDLPPTLSAGPSSQPRNGAGLMPKGNDGFGLGSGRNSGDCAGSSKRCQASSQAPAPFRW